MIKILLALCILGQCLSSLKTDWEQLDQIVNEYINSGGFPGAALRIANKTHTLYSNNYGHISKNTPPFSAPVVSNGTIYDIASLSKVTGTLGCIMQLVDTGLLEIEDPVINYIPEYDNHGKAPTTIQNLLLHNAGLLPDYPGQLPSTKQ